jgi:hypothetical protein
MPGDDALIQTVETAMAEAARQSGGWLVCRLREGLAVTAR